MISKELWEKNQPPANPFMNFYFLDALIQSESASTESGWKEVFFQSEDGILLNFIKSHSYGEYIFDWAWAEAYERYGVPYYPKLTSMIPFTPVTTNHFLMKTFDETKAQKLLTLHEEYFTRGPFSSSHFLFLTPEEIPVFKNYLIRESIQYHFFNQEYESFEQFLSTLKSRKRKTINLERSFPALEIEKITGDKLTEAHARQMYAFYISTIVNKNSFDYLNEDFFLRIFRTMKDQILYVEARENSVPVAGSLFFYDSENLYGRYWGSTSYIENLHFELCYYQGIDFVIEKKLKVFEAGAQGEHKIARGFRPVRVYSAHKLKNEAFHNAIADFIRAEKAKVEFNIRELSKLLPFST